MKIKMILVLLIISIIITSCKGPELNNGQNETNEENKETISNGSGGNSLDDFFSKMSATPEYKVGYNTKTTTEDGTQTAKQTWVLKNKNIRIDFETEEGKVSSYVVDQKTYVCTTMQSQTICYESQEADTSDAEKDADLRENWKNYDMNILPPRTIAGTLTTCFGYKLSEVETEYCYSKEYVPLYIKITGQGMSTEMTATEYSATVSDSEFKLPATPQQIPKY